MGVCVRFYSTNPTKWLNTLKQFVGCYRRYVWVFLTILHGWHLKVSSHVCCNVMPFWGRHFPHFKFFHEINRQKFYVFLVTSDSILMIEIYALYKGTMKKRIRPLPERKALVEYVLFTHDKACFSWIWKRARFCFRYYQFHISSNIFYCSNFLQVSIFQIQCI